MNASAISHLERLVWLLTQFNDERIELLEHRYYPATFGSFELVLSKGHKQLRFVWDGKEFMLRLDFATVQNKSIAPAWTHDANFSLPDGGGLYEEIWSQSVDMFAT